MNLFETLKEFKNIEPGADYKEKSKRIVLASPLPAPKWSLGRTLLGIVETGVAVSLTGFFIFLLAGGLSGSKLAPVEFEAVNPVGIKAEAQAIDIQIELANLNYKEVVADSETTPVSEPVKPTALMQALTSTISIASSSPTSTPADDTSALAAAEATTTATSTSFTIDQTLEKLSN